MSGKGSSVPHHSVGCCRGRQEVGARESLSPDGRLVSSSRFWGGIRWDTGRSARIRCYDGRIVEPDDEPDSFDCDGLTAAPGLIDLQINGAFGHDFTADPGSIWEVGSRLPESGVTAFLPTIVSSEPETVAEARQVLLSGPPHGWAGALPLGLHCEGPMISPSRRGTHPGLFLVEPSPDYLDRWGGLDGIRMVTLAPELHGAEETVRRLVRDGVVVAAGHSDADFATAVASFGWGISHVTHLFNAMSGLHHRRPGLVGATLATRSVTAGMIADGLHAHPAAAQIAYLAKGACGITLVTDAMAGMGEGSGTYPLGARTVRVTGSQALNEEGGLAGSVLTMDEAVRNFRSWTGCSLASAIGSASATPAAVLADPARGHLSPGGRGDITFLDASVRVAMTVVGGRVVFDRDGRAR